MELAVSYRRSGADSKCFRSVIHRYIEALFDICLYSIGQVPGAEWFRRLPCGAGNEWLARIPVGASGAS